MCTGVVTAGEIVDLTDSPVGMPRTMEDLLALGSGGIAAARAAPNTSARRFALGEVELLAPVTNPPKFLGIGMNYREHVAELGKQLPEYQYWFNKQRTCVVGHRSPVLIPKLSDQVDYEGELGIVIGRRCRNVPEERAVEVVAGFTVVNDVSIRDFQWRTPTFTMGKSFDSHGPIGPWITTPDEVEDPGDLSIKTWVNDELRQDARTSDMIFKFDEMIAYLTSVFPLEPGDVLATGTPAGVGANFTPPRWLTPGDTVRIEIEGIGTLENSVVAETELDVLGV
jgi:2-keto-4-pentenoate hydratase/2-oxohepta-3-ene-1,7-dioic acid hydratase in catechol pathway